MNAAYNDEFRARLESASKAVMDKYTAIFEAETKRMLALWPYDLIPPVLVYNKSGNLLGLGIDKGIGQPPLLVVPANKIKFSIT